MIRLRLLGETAIDVDDATGASTPVGPESQVLFAVLLVLALERGRRLARTALHRLLWPGADDETGRHNLRQVLYKLRQLGVPVEATQSSVMLPASDVTGELVELTGGGDTGTEAGEAAGRDGIAARLVGGRRVGELLPGYAPTFSAPFADWIDEQRALLQAQLRRSLLAALAESRAGGRWREVEAIAREVLRFDPLNEAATLALAEATALVGAKAQALGIIDRYLDELGGRPADVKLPATVLRRRIAERFPTHRYVSAADACFVGRAAEMATLLGLWHRARERRGGGVLLWGEPGIGKTRLALELGRVATLQGAQVQRVASRSWDVQRPLGAIVDIVPPLRDLPGAAGVDPVCNAYLDRLTKHDPDRPLADLPDPATLHRQVRQAVFDLIDALLAEAPLVLVFEDVQWLDVSSWEVLAELLRLARTRRLLLVLTSRAPQPAQMPESEDWEALRRLRLDGIDATATNELLDAMTREAGKYIDPDYREWCVPLANGNPLHVQEIALQWLEKGSVREAPGSLRAMIEARIDRLSSTARVVLQLASAMGPQSKLLWLPKAELVSPREVLEAATELDLLRLASSDGARLVPRHAVIEDIARSHMGHAADALVNRAAATALEHAAAQTLDTQVQWQAVQCWQRAGDSARAVQSVVRCASHLMQVGLPLQALALLDLAEPLACDVEARGTIISMKALTLAQDDQWQRVRELLDGYRPETAPSAGAPSGAAILRLLEARWRQYEDDLPLVIDAIALTSSTLYDAPTRLRAATFALVLIDNRDGSLTEYSACEPIVERLISSAAVPAAEIHRYLMILHASRGRPMESAKSARRLIDSFDYEERPFDTTYLRQAAYALRQGGFLAEAERALMLALDLARSQACTHSALYCYQSLAQLALYQQSVPRLQEWVELATATPAFAQNPLAHHSIMYTLAQLYAITGQSQRLDEASVALGDPFTPDRNSRRRMARLATALRARLSHVSASGGLGAHDQALLTASLRELELHQHRGLADFVISTCARALLAASRYDEADALLTAYVVHHRLERCSLHLDLQQIWHERAQAINV